MLSASDMRDVFDMTERFGIGIYYDDPWPRRPLLGGWDVQPIEEYGTAHPKNGALSPQ